MLGVPDRRSKCSGLAVAFRHEKGRRKASLPPPLSRAALFRALCHSAQLPTMAFTALLPTAVAVTALLVTDSALPETAPTPEVMP